MTLERKLKSLVLEIVREAKSNEAFAKRLSEALDIPSDAPPSARRNRRPPAAFDPFEQYRSGEAVLRDRLATLDLEQLRDMIAQYGMDRSKLARKWKDTQRLIDLIVSTVSSRSEKGNAFRTTADAEPAKAVSPDASSRE